MHERGGCSQSPNHKKKPEGPQVSVHPQATAVPELLSKPLRGLGAVGGLLEGYLKHESSP